MWNAVVPPVSLWPDCLVVVRWLREISRCTARQSHLNASNNACGLKHFISTFWHSTNSNKIVPLQINVSFAEGSYFITILILQHHSMLAYQRISPARGTSILFLTRSVFRRGVVSTSPNPEAGGPPLVGCPQLLIQYSRSYPPYWRPFLHPQLEDAPCRG